jgi:FkbM family methyltransferase
VNDHAYRILCRVVRVLLRSSLLSAVASSGSRALLRQSRTLTFLRRLRFDGVIDGGANIGEFAELVRMALPGAHLICVEPLPQCARLLSAAGFEVEEAALWSADTRLTLTLESAALTSATVMKQGDGIEVRAMRLDTLPIKGKRVLIKLDLQGAEREALRGLGDLVSSVAAFVLEVSFGPRGSYRELHDLMTDWGFLEYATLNEFEVDGVVVEADKVFLRTAEFVDLELL